ncbi:MAG: CHASE domain-containing protein [Pseudomonadota bacterium]|nr:CHASE domain-containing protein [Pseudomonadota bacterium]
MSIYGWRSYVPILLVVVLGMLVTWFIFKKISDLEGQRQFDAFSAAARDRVLVIQRELDHTLEVVLDLGSFFDASERVTRREFRDFVGPALKRNAGIKALYWVSRVPSEERSAFLAEARRSYTPFRIKEREADVTLERPIHFPVLYIQPYSSNKALLGFDLASDPDELAFLRATARSAVLGASLPVDVSPATGRQSWFSVYGPVFEAPGDEEPSESEATALQGRPLNQKLRGFVAGRFLVENLVEQALRNLGPSGVDMRFFASAPESPAYPFYFHASRSRKDLPVGASLAADPDLVEYRGEIQVGDRRWIVVCNPVPGYFESESWSAYLILGGGVAFTLLSSIFLFSSIGRAQQVRHLVAQRTVELERSNSALNKEIGERRRAEQALQILNVTLEQRVARRTAEAEHRARDLEQFAYVASHDLKAPLRAIANLAGWLKEDLRNKLTSQTSEQIDLMQDRVARMNALVEGLLAYSRIGRTAGTVEDVDTVELVRDTIDSLAPPRGYKVKVKDGMPRLFTDRLHIGQVFANLIGNAINHHDREKGVIRVSGKDLGDRCEFSVTDDGPGIPSEYQDKVFMMFQTLQVKDFGIDTGIGLALVKKLVEEHGGSISLDSGPGRGSRFTFTWVKEEP